MTKPFKTYLHADTCIVMFARTPEKGKVKTRLIPALGEQGALDLHIDLVRRQIGLLNETSLCQSQLWLDASKEHLVTATFHGKIQKQSEGDLGEKMYQASSSVLKDYAQMIIIGSDCPQIDEGYLSMAILELKKPETDVVLGPALDGGYVLIGMKRAKKNIFENIEWGTEKVLRQTIRSLEDEGLKFSKLPTLRDIDTVDDLEVLR